jgi:hypothetical protein
MKRRIIGNSIELTPDSGKVFISIDGDGNPGYTDRLTFPAGLESKVLKDYTEVDKPKEENNAEI